MKDLTKISLSLTGWLFLFQITSAQTVNKHSLIIGLSSGIAQMHGNGYQDVNGYYNAGLNLGYFPVDNFAFGFELNANNTSIDDGPFPGVGLGIFIRLYLAKNFYSHTTYEAGVAGDGYYEYDSLTFNVGYSLFLSKSFALEPKVFYVFHNESRGENHDYSGPGIGLGIQLFTGPN